MDIANQDKNEKIKTPEGEVISGERPTRFEQEREKNIEKKEISPDEEIVSAKLRRELEKMEMDEEAKGDVEKKAQTIEFLGEKEKIEHLLTIVREKGVVYAIQVAKRMNEPFLLDILHDTLAQEGYYKKISSNANDDGNDNK